MTSDRDMNEIAEPRQGANEADGIAQGVNEAARSSKTRVKRFSAPPDDRTPQEVEDDEQAEARHWQDCLREGYEAAREHAETARNRSWARRLRRAMRNLFR
ncbi:hypothetical protein [Caballeronia sp. BR00000012568055]|uniref:hypothetical protein n=1 Tax=Caballeronia sp. BR00000012568055 TaxID=2918761 RepID=UPI0023F78B98|nr:hypothetical protein [Caballeronia sp. BR00000012568055]